MAEMTSWERFKRAFEHKEADRVPMTDEPWAGTIKRWHREGMPVDVSWVDFFEVDKVAHIHIDISPRFPCEVIEENDRYIIYTTEYGATTKEFKEDDSTPEVLEFKVNSPEAWESAKKRMTLSDDRIPWDTLKKEYDRWRAEGYWIRANFWFGFDVTHSRLIGTEPTLIYMLEEPEFIEDVFDTYLNSCEQLFNRIWDAGYHFDQIYWWDDMGYKGTSFFSPNMYRNMLQPYHKRAVDWAHNKGAYAELHSCGNITELMPDIMATGVDALNPLEVKSGLDAKMFKEVYGDNLVLHGGVNAAIWHDPEKVVAEIKEKVPMLKENGGYIFSSDHSIPNDVSLDTMKLIIETAKEVGKF